MPFTVAQALVGIVDRAHSLSRILDEAVRLVAHELQVDGCSAFLIDKEGSLVRSAVDASARLVACEGADAEPARVALRVVSENVWATASARFTTLLACPMVLHGETLGALVLQALGERQFAGDDVEALTAIAAQLVGIVGNAQIIEALERGEQPPPRGLRRPRAPEAESEERRLQGVSGSPGVAVGFAVFRGSHRANLAARESAVGDPDVERGRVRVAVEKARNDLLRIQTAAAREIDEEHALIFAPHLLLLNDPMLLARVDRHIADGASAARAVQESFEHFEARLRLVPDAYIQEKLDDVEDLLSRLLSHLVGDQRERAGPRVVISSYLGPSIVVEMKAEGAQALVTEGGGATSHGVLLARAVGIPAVTGVANASLEIRPGDAVIVDGGTGVVIVRPTAATIATYEEMRRQAERARSEYGKYKDVLTRTADGARVSLYANVGVASDLAVALQNGAEGIGLYRTEFPFIVRDTFPTRAEQVRIYRKAYELFPSGRIHFRILDLGGDKFVSAGPIIGARNAFHGYRSLRVLFDHPDVLLEQVRALAIAAGDRKLCILIPMVSSMEELRRAKGLIAEALGTVPAAVARPPVEIGAMIEVPAAVELSADIAREVDFLSIGTNDLMQYTLVVDREDARMASLSDPYHPAILRMIARIASAARAAGKPIGVCGEIAVRADLALAMMALGVDSLSVVPSEIPELKRALAGACLDAMRRAMPEILTLADARSIAEALRRAFGESS